MRDKRGPSAEDLATTAEVTAATLFRGGVRLAGVIAVIIGGLWLAAWLSGGAARSSASGAITMKTNAAVAIVLAGFALLLLGPQGARGWRRWTGAIASTFVLLIGALTLGEHLFAYDLGIDQLLAVEPPGAAATVSGNRMGPPASSSFLLLGLGLLSLARRRPRTITAYLGLATCVISLVPAVGYLFGIDTFYGTPMTGIAWPTVVALLLLGIGLVLSSGDDGPMSLLLRQDAGGALLRRLLPWAILLPLVLGFLRVQGERVGLYDRPTGRGMLIIALVCVSTVLLWRSAGRLSRSSRMRRAADDALRESEERLRLFVEHAPAAVAMFDREMRYIAASRRMLADFHIPSTEVVGKSYYEVAAEMPERWKGMHQCCLAGTAQKCEEDSILRADGTRDWVRWEIYPWRDTAGEIGGIVQFSEIITERKLAERRLAYLASFPEQDPNPIIEADGEGRVRYANPAALHAFPDVREKGIAHPWLADWETAAPAILEGRIDTGVRTVTVGERIYHQTLLRAVEEGVVRAYGLDITDRSRAEAAVRASEERFRALGAASSEALYRMSPDWSEMRQLHGGGFLASTERPSQSWIRDYIHPEDEAQVRAGFAEAIRTKRMFEMEYRVRRADGSVGWTASRAVPITDADGEVVEWFGAASDITERRRMERELRESEQRFRIMADTSPVVMWVTDREGGIQFVNRTFREFFGVTYQQVQGPRWQPLVHPDDAPDYVAAFLASVRDQRSFAAHARVRRADGAWRWIGSQAEPRFSSSGEFLGHVGASLDITDRKEAEDALQEADKRKTEFLAMLSHELRNPLTPIRNSLYVLDRAVPGGEQAERAQRIIDRQTAHMTRLIDDLLDVTRISRGKINLQRERLELCTVVRRTIEDYRSLFLRSGIALDVRIPDECLWVNADETRLAQVIGNLLQNAAKFTSRGGTTALAVEKDAAAGVALLCVRDTGAGLSAEMLPRLFEPFTQADSTLDRSKGGLGLGLALVKGLVELHGGTVDASSAGVGTGAEFTVRLPLERSSPGAAADGVSAPRESSSRRRVLIIEDNIDSAESLKEALTFGDHEVAVAYDGPGGIAKAREFQPDVVLCDLGLAGMDGCDVARALRADATLQGVLLVALTGYAAPEDQLRAAEAGFHGHLAKPPDFEQLSEVLAHAPSASRSQVLPINRSS